MIIASLHHGINIGEQKRTYRNIPELHLQTLVPFYQFQYISIHFIYTCPVFLYCCPCHTVIVKLAQDGAGRPDFLQEVGCAVFVAGSPEMASISHGFPIAPLLCGLTNKSNQSYVRIVTNRTFMNILTISHV